MQGFVVLKRYNRLLVGCIKALSNRGNLRIHFYLLVVWLRFISKTHFKEESNVKLLILQYRGRISDDFSNSLKRINAPCKVVFTMKKLKTLLPTLKPKVDISLKSRVVYKITCPRCNSCYVGQTVRHLLSRFREHKGKSSPVGIHFHGVCDVALSFNDVSILATSCKSISHLMTLEALWIDRLKPSINTKDEYRSRKLTIKIWLWRMFFRNVLYIYSIF